MNRTTRRVLMHFTVVTAAVCLLASVFLAGATARDTTKPARADVAEPTRRTTSATPIDPATPVNDLLPAPPASKRPPAPPTSLEEVEEVALESLFTTSAMSVEAFTKHTAQTIVRINHLNRQQQDGFIKTLIERRQDLAGLPFILSPDCRSNPDRSGHFQHSLDAIGQYLRAGAGDTPLNWENYRLSCSQEDRSHKEKPGINKEDRRNMITDARIAALMQVLGPENSKVRVELADHLASISHVQATRALAKQAVFGLETTERQAAIDALRLRRERDYTDILVTALDYPWPEVAENACQAIAQLQRSDLLPQLIEALEQPDPRAPVARNGSKSSLAVRELVRIDHQRNCLLCHAPGNTPDVPKEALVVVVPQPGSSSAYYHQKDPDIFVRVDVTYLRQDFSALQDGKRFDFLVRTRLVSEKEAMAHRERLTDASPYRSSVTATLRTMTGKDAGTDARAWRELFAAR